MFQIIIKNDPLHYKISHSNEQERCGGIENDSMRDELETKAQTISSKKCINNIIAGGNMCSLHPHTCNVELNKI